MGCTSGASGGGAGKFGGGMIGKNTGTTVRNSHPLADEIDRGGGGFANEIMNTRDAFEAEYGDAVKRINLHAATFSDGSVLGAYGDNTLYMNQKYIKNANLTEAMQAAAKSGFHPSIGNKKGTEAVAAHEIGHRLGQMAAQKAGISEKEIVARAGKKVGIRTNIVLLMLTQSFPV